MNPLKNDPQATKGFGALRLLYIVGIVVFFASAAFAITLTVQRADQQIRHALLVSARLVAEGLQASDVELLVEGSPTEQRAAADRIHQQLSKQVVASDRFAYIYLMDRDTEGNVYFLVDAQRPEEDSPPAQLEDPYDEASKELKAIFDNRTEFVEGPIADQWGTWISPFVPILDPVSGEMQAVLGLDVSAKDWKLYLAGIAALPALLFITLAALILSLRRTLTNREALRQHNRKLESANDELVRQSEMAREKAAEAKQADRAKSAFLAAMSHEIRTPLNSVIGMTSLMLNSKLDAEQSNYISTIRKSGDALLDLINDILDFSKIESGRLELDRIEFQLEDCIFEGLEIMALQAIEKNIAIAANIELAMSRAWYGDAGRIRQIILNLVSNAIRFSKPGGTVAIHVDWQPGAAGQALLTVEVADEGVGIPEEARENIFQAFVQADSSITRVHGGTGLGLAISRQIARLMDGDLTFESEVNKGTTFKLELPLKFVEKSGTLIARTGNEKLDELEALVLVACPTDQLFFQNVAKATGLKFHPASSVDDAVALLETEAHLSFVVLDEQLIAKEDQASLLKQIFEHSKHPDLITLYISDQASGSVFKQKTNEALKVQRLARPLRPSTFVSTLIHGIDPEAPVPGRDDAKAKHHISEQLADECPLQILLVEDNKLNQRIMQQILGKMGYSIDLAENGLLATEALADKSYDLVLMDLEMPVMDGITATDLIRRHATQGERIVIAALSAHVLSERREECFKAGMDDFLAKPVRVSELTEVIRRTSRKEYT